MLRHVASSMLARHGRARRESGFRGDVFLELETNPDKIYKSYWSGSPIYTALCMLGY